LANVQAGADPRLSSKKDDKKWWRYYYLKTKEFCVCFVCSFFPSWSVEMYLENINSEIAAISQGEEIQVPAQNPQMLMLTKIIPRSMQKRMITIMLIWIIT